VGNQNSRAATLTPRRKDRDDGRRHLRDDRHPLLLGLDNGRIDGKGRTRGEKHEGRQNQVKNQQPRISELGFRISDFSPSLPISVWGRSRLKFCFECIWPLQLA